MDFPEIGHVENGDRISLAQGFVKTAMCPLVSSTEGNL